MPRQRISINSKGELTGIYSDALNSLFSSRESSNIRRASHVEPGLDGKWYADLSPVSGPVLGPFVRRQDALDAEVQYLTERITTL